MSTTLVTPVAPTTVSLDGGWRPTLHLGATSPGGLALPAADATRSHLYAPRGVWLDDERLITCDSGNHRILIWMLSASEEPEIGGLGSTTNREPGSGEVRGALRISSTEGSSRPPRPARNSPVHEGFAVPGGLGSTTNREPGSGEVRGALRISPTEGPSRPPRPARNSPAHEGFAVPGGLGSKTGAPADVVLGQADFRSAIEQPHVPQGPCRLRFPYGIALCQDRLAVADSGNNRVTIWSAGD